MRKSEREIADVQEKFAALLRCGYMTLAVEGEGAPYCVPLNFGAELMGDTVVLYFHCAKEGKKLDLLRKNPRVGFSAANMLRVFNKGVAPCGYTTDYESVCGTGRAEILEDERARLHGLQVLMKHYSAEDFPAESFSPKALSLTCVVRISVDSWSGKRLVRP